MAYGSAVDSLVEIFFADLLAARIDLTASQIGPRLELGTGIDDEFVCGINSTEQGMKLGTRSEKVC